jgi:hypothetical protein
MSGRRARARRERLICFSACSQPFHTGLEVLDFSTMPQTKQNPTAHVTATKTVRFSEEAVVTGRGRKGAWVPPPRAPTQAGVPAVAPAGAAAHMPTPAPAAAAAVAFTQQDPIEAAAARCDDWLRAHDLQPSADSTGRRLRLHHGCTDIEAVRSAAMNAVSRALALAADGFVSPEELYDETIDEAACLANDARRDEAHAALEQLRDLGVGEEHLRTLSTLTSWEELRGELLPVLHEMIFYATVGATEAARRKAPSASSYGATLRWPVALGTALGVSSGPCAVVVVPRLEEDVAWVHRLPAGVDFHIMQRSGVLQPQFAPEKQTAMEAAGAAAEAGASPPSASLALVAFLQQAAENEDLIEALRDPEFARQADLVVTHDRAGTNGLTNGPLMTSDGPLMAL